QDSIFRQIALNTSEIMTPSLLIERNTYVDKKLLFFEKLSRGQETYFLINLLTRVDRALVIQSDKKLFEYIYHDQSITKSDELYNSSHVRSKAIVFAKIWSLNMEFGDAEVTNRMYQKSIKLLFSSLRNKDYQVSKSILKGIKTNLKPNNSKIYFRVVICYMLLRVLRRPKF